MKRKFVVLGALWITALSALSGGCDGLEQSHMSEREAAADVEDAEAASSSVAETRHVEHATRRSLSRLDEVLSPDAIEVLRADIAAGIPIDEWGSLAESHGVARRDEVAWNESLMITPDGAVVVVSDDAPDSAAGGPGAPGARVAAALQGPRGARPTNSTDGAVGPSAVAARWEHAAALPSQVTAGISGNDDRFRTANRRVVWAWIAA